VIATKVELHGTAASNLMIETPAGNLEVKLQVPGLYNAYNGLAAVTAALAFGIARDKIKAGIEKFTAAFGRIERIDVPGGKQLLMALVKNPVGFNEVLRMLFPLEERLGEQQVKPKHLLIIINDLIADGRDVSWLWDVDFEIISAASGLVSSVHVSGIRASDMAVRLKYAGVETEKLHIEPAIDRALNAALNALPEGETLYVLPTYTAMLDFRKMLHGRGWVKSQFWEQ
jgi:UDP-N-acetylmuramyl tripeptide synthase